MNTISLYLTARPQGDLRWSKVKQQVTEWWHCIRWKARVSPVLDVRTHDRHPRLARSNHRPSTFAG
jgi:hypothetical protein